jgi:ABC-2 type transport system ATP-binding protein
MSTPTIEIQRLSKSFSGATDVLKDLDWTLPPGAVVGLLGRNGSGKTTLLQCALGLLEPSAGEARIFGESVTGLSDATRARLGYVPQDSALFEWLTARQMLDYFKAMYPRWNDAKVDGLLSRWAIDPDRQISKLSGGEKQRLSIIRALGPDPDLLILDEPVSGLDPIGRREFLRELVERILDKAATVVFSTHILSDLERIAGEVALLKGGRIAYQGPLDQTLDAARRIVGPAGAMAAVHVEHELARTANDGEVSVIALPSAEEAQALADNAQLSVQRITLEDLFVEAA